MGFTTCSPPAKKAKGMTVSTPSKGHKKPPPDVEPVEVPAVEPEKKKPGRPKKVQPEPEPSE